MTYCDYNKYNNNIADFADDNILLNRDTVLSLIKNIPGNVLLFNERSELVMCSKSTLDVFSCGNLDEFKKKFYSRFSTTQSDGSSSSEYLSGLIERAIAEGSCKAEWIFNDSHGNALTALVSFIALRHDDSGSEGVNHAMAIFQDVSPYVIQHEKNIAAIANLKAIMDVSPLSLTIIDSNMEIIMCNMQAVKLFKLESEEQYLKEFSSLSPKYQPNGELSSELSKTHVAKAFKDGYNKFSWMHCIPDGNEIPCEITLSKMMLEDGREVVSGFIRDLRPEFLGDEKENLYDYYFYNEISDRVLLSRIAELSDEWFFALDTRTSVIQYYGKIIQEFGQKSSIKVKFGTTLEKGVVHPEDNSLYIELKENMLKGIYVPLDIRYLQGDGSYRYYRLVYQTIYDDNNKPVFVVGKGVDVHERKIYQQRSEIDLLTGCYNKISSEHIISKKLIEGKDKTHALFVVDIDNFKAVNDNLGHFFGDEVLKEVSTNLKASFRSDDIIARIGGDEFMVFIENAHDDAILRQKADRIVEAFKRNYAGEFCDYEISGSVGISFYPKSGTNYDELYKAADKALYRAKLLGKNQYVFYDETLIEGTMRDLTKLENVDRIASSYFDYDLISSVFNILYERNGDAISVNFAMQYICQKYNADRCYIFETFDNGLTYDNTYEWCKEGISKEIDNLQGTPREIYVDFFGSARNGIVYSNDLKEIFTTNEAYKLMADQGIISFVHAQVKKEELVTFFLGMDDCTKARVWSEKEINSLRYIAKIISLMLQGENLRNEIDRISEYNMLSAFVSDNSDDIVYVSDIETYELIYLNKSALRGFNLTKEEEWKGKRCYEVLQQKSAPCEFCTNHLLNENDFYEWTYYNPVIERTYLLKDKLISMNNKLSRLEIATDISNVVDLESKLKERVEEQKLLISCVDTLHSGEKPKVSIDKLLKMIAEYHNAERSYIFELSQDRETVSNTYEWCAKGIIPQQHILQDVPSTNLSNWFLKYAEVGEFYINSLVEDMSKDSPEYALLKAQGITSLATAPIHESDGSISGFIGVDNPKENIKNTKLLRSVARFIANFLDQTELLSELRKLSYFDTLTGLKNRHSYRKALNDIDKVKISSLGVAYADIKGLGSINDIFGQEYGDNVIKKVGSIIENEFHEDVYRVGGDEFVVVKPNIDERQFESCIERIRAAFMQEENYYVTLGYTFNRTFTDIAISKGAIPGRKYSAILSLNLDKEIESNKFVVFLQPQIDLNTDTFSGAEALIRRKNSDGSIQPPIAFLPFFEKEGIVSKIDVFVFETVCKELKRWTDLGYSNNTKISVNCSRITVSEKGIVEKFCDICKKYSVDKSRIIIEITETISGTNNEMLSKILNSFKAAGFSISLDDFGCGFSNLSTLKLSNFDEIKIDMGITQGLHTDRKSETLTKVALDLCCELEGLSSVAEGIECIEQYNMLKNMKCDKGQGYYIDKPLDIETFTAKYIFNKERM